MEKIIKSILINWPALAKVLRYFYLKLWLFDIHKIFNLPFKVSINNVSLILYPQGQIARILYMKKFEEKELFIFSNLIKPGMKVVDAGANIGLYSLIASKLVGEHGQVFSYEPSKETFERLSKNIDLNQSQNVNTFNLGLGDDNNQELVLRQDIGYEDAERYLVPNDVMLDDKLSNVKELDKEENVKVVTLDNHLNIFDTNSIDFLKIDTEGFEYYILKGAKNILKNPKLVILFECTELGTRRANTTQKQVFDILFEAGFELYYWNVEIEHWSNDLVGCYAAGDLWASKSIDYLNATIC